MGNKHAQNLRIAATLIETNGSTPGNELASDIRDAADEIDRLEARHPISTNAALAYFCLGGFGIGQALLNIFWLLGGF